MLALLRALLITIAALAALSAALIIASLFITDRAPVSTQAFVVSLVVSALFLVIAGVAAGIRRHVGRLASAGAALPETAGAAFHGAFGALVRYLLVGAGMMALFLALLTYIILARIDQNFAVFG